MSSIVKILNKKYQAPIIYVGIHEAQAQYLSRNISCNEYCGMSLYLGFKNNVLLPSIATYLSLRGNPSCLP
jgi:hypothetical protein